MPQRTKPQYIRKHHFFVRNSKEQPIGVIALGLTDNNLIKITGSIKSTMDVKNNPALSRSIAYKRLENASLAFRIKKDDLATLHEGSVVTCQDGTKVTLLTSVRAKKASHGFEKRERQTPYCEITVDDVLNKSLTIEWDIMLKQLRLNGPADAEKVDATRFNHLLKKQISLMAESTKPVGFFDSLVRLWTRKRKGTIA